MPSKQERDKSWSEFAKWYNSLTPDTLYDILFYDIPICYQLLYALAFSAAKWHKENPVRGLGGITSCALCWYAGRYGKKEEDEEETAFEVTPSKCNICPLGIIGQSCYNEESIFEQWWKSKIYKNKPELAQLKADKMFDLLRKLYSKEANKLEKKGFHEWKKNLKNC